MRHSIDVRYQREGEELTDLVLQRHFGRLSWEEVYASCTRSSASGGAGGGRPV
jgi:hypothetical protein